MDFSQALLLLKQGRAVRRRGWERTVKYNRKLSMRLSGEGDFYVKYTGYGSRRGMIPAEDILADDWEAIP